MFYNITVRMIKELKAYEVFFSKEN